MWESLIIVSVILVYFFTRNQKKESEEEIEEETQIEVETEKGVKEETQFDEETEKMVNRLLSQEVEEKEEKTNSLKDRLYRLNRKPPLVVIVVVTSLTFILTYNIFEIFKGGKWYGILYYDMNDQTEFKRIFSPYSKDGRFNSENECMDYTGEVLDDMELGTVGDYECVDEN